MQIINLDFHSKACVWLKDSPNIFYPVLDIITKDIQTGLANNLRTRQADLEIFIPVGPRICCGLLGVKFIPNDSGKISVEVQVSTESESIFKNSIAAKIDKVRIGLPKEYSESVIDEIAKSLNHRITEILGSGVIILDKAAHGEISSSKKFFRNIAATVINLLLLDQVSSQADVTEIIKTYSLI